MKKYEKPNVSIVEFASETVVTLSNNATNDSIAKVQTTFKEINF